MARSLPPRHRAGGDGADLHAGHLHVDAVYGAAVDLGRRVQASLAAADQAEVRGVLQGHVMRHGQPCRGVRKRAVAQRSPARRMRHRRRAPRGTLRRPRPIAPPPPRSAWCVRPRLPRAAAANRHGSRWTRPSPAIAQQRIGVQRRVRRRRFQPHLVEPDFQFLGQQHGRGGPDALTASRCCAMISVTVPLRSMRTKALGAKGAVSCAAGRGRAGAG